MKRCFTRETVSEIFRQWPQAVSMDEGDLRILHDVASAGAQIWNQRLRWPDYLWLDFEDEHRTGAAVEASAETYYIADPTGTGPEARFSAISQTLDKSQLPPTGHFQIGQRVSCMLELKVIDADLVPRLFAYEPRIPWPNFLHVKLEQWFGNRLRDADAQIAGGKRLLPFGDALGVAVIVNEKSPNLPSKIVSGYLTNLVHRLPNLDAILYLADDENPPAPAFVIKGDQARLNRFITQATMMLHSFHYGEGLPASRSGPHPQLVARIEMDSRSLAMFRNWSTAWRVADDPTPIPAPSMAISFVPREEFVSGLRRTAPEPGLLDCHFRWDPDGKNLRLES